MKSRTGFFSLGTLFGLVLGAALTAHAADSIDHSAERIARALERIAQAVDRGANR